MLALTISAALAAIKLFSGSMTITISAIIQQSFKHHYQQPLLLQQLQLVAPSYHSAAQWLQAHVHQPSGFKPIIIQWAPSPFPPSSRRLHAVTTISTGSIHRLNLPTQRLCAHINSLSGSRPIIDRLYACTLSLNSAALRPYSLDSAGSTPIIIVALRLLSSQRLQAHHSAAPSPLSQLA